MDFPTDSQFEQVSRQLAELLRHVAEVRNSNQRLESGQQRLAVGLDEVRVRTGRLEERMDELRERTGMLETSVDQLKSDVKGLHIKFVEVEDNLALKMTCLTDVCSSHAVNESVNLRIQFQGLKKTHEARIDAIESRLERLDAGAQRDTA